jgi:hypothetical protein
LQTTQSFPGRLITYVRKAELGELTGRYCSVQVKLNQRPNVPLHEHQTLLLGFGLGESIHKAGIPGDACRG